MCILYVCMCICIVHMFSTCLCCVGAFAAVALRSTGQLHVRDLRLSGHSLKQEVSCVCVCVCVCVCLCVQCVYSVGMGVNWLLHIIKLCVNGICRSQSILKLQTSAKASQVDISSDLIDLLLISFLNATAHMQGWPPPAQLQLTHTYRCTYCTYIKTHTYIHMHIRM